MGLGRRAIHVWGHCAGMPFQVEHDLTHLSQTSRGELEEIAFGSNGYSYPINLHIINGFYNDYITFGRRFNLQH